MDQFTAGSIVWASARRDIFWPGVVVDAKDTAPIPAKKYVSVNFLIEDSYEDIKSPSKIFLWNCEKQNTFIEKGRALKSEERKIIFNRAVAKADNLLKQDVERRVVNSSETQKIPNVTIRRSTIKQHLESLDGALEQNGSNCEVELDTAKANEEKGIMKSQKEHVLKGQSNYLTSEANETKEHSQAFQRHQSLSKEKRKRKEKDPRKKILPAKKAKSSDQVVLSEVKPEQNEKNVEELDLRTSTCNKDNLVADAISTNGNSSITSEGSSDDEELMSELFSPSQEADNHFSVGDIVWAKYYREPYWPAVVKKIIGKTKKEKKYVVKFLGWDDGLFKVQPKKLEHYARDQNREKFMPVRDTLNDKDLVVQFDLAVDEADDFLTRKALGKSLDEELDSKIDKDEIIFEEIEEEDETQSAGDVQAEEEYLRTHNPSERRKSYRTKRQVSQYGDILSYIRQAKPILKQILDGKRSSERHMTFMSGTTNEKNQLKHRAGFGPVGNEAVRNQIMDRLVEFFREIKGNTLGISYVSEVWLPEAIIWSIQEINHVNRERAEEMFLEGSKSTVTNAEVEEFKSTLKKKGRVNREEVEKRIRRAERAMAC